MRHRSIFLTVLAFCVPAAGHAADAQGSAALYGAGGIRCQVLTQNPQFDQLPGGKPTVIAWMAGYLSASNVERTNTFDLSPVADEEFLYGLVKQDCRMHPEFIIQQTFANIINRLSVAKTYSRSPQVQVHNDFGTVIVRQDVITQMQKYLVGKGLFKGYVDGKYTPALLASVKSFQAANKLPETGLPDAATIVKTIVEPALASPANKSR